MSDIAKVDFDKLSAEESDKHIATSPFTSYAFLQALENSNSVGGESGWLPQHIVVSENQQVIAFLPAYIKTHSYGEYVFDHSWAHAYQQHGLAYYPKLSVCVPFTPVTGPRLLLAKGVKYAEIIAFLASHKANIMDVLRLSSIHCLFMTEDVSNCFATHDFHQRQSVQFNWHNKNYANFDDFLSSLTARRRRSIRKERTAIGKQNTIVKRIVGAKISAEDIAFFYTCYQQTYLKRSGHIGYLNHDFFKQLLTNMPENLMLVLAEQDQNPIASALFLFDNNGLYGRYWGALSEVSGLHFEACYYQGIAFCIERNIPLFNPGTQGEHKILRGFEPTLCYSNHTMKEAAFDEAVHDFLKRERPHILTYQKESASLLPYKQNSEDTA